MDLSKPNYKAWLISEKDFPSQGSMEDKIRFLVGYGILAPSTHNTQPWQFETTGDTLHIKPAYDRGLAVGDPENRGLFMSLGACAENIICAASHFGLTTDISVDDDTVNVRFTSAQPGNASIPLSSIVRRYSAKYPYTTKQFDATTIKAIHKSPAYGTEVVLVTEPGTKAKLVGYHMAAAEATADNKAFVQELTGWMRPNWTKATDGMPGFTIGSSGLKSAVGKYVLRKKPELLKKAASQDKVLLESASALAVFGVSEQNIAAWVNAGRAVEALWLTLTTHGLVAHPQIASIVEADTRQKVARILAMSTEPVFLLRIGYGEKPVMHTPRKEAT